jgi:hypothetical protein
MSAADSSPCSRHALGVQLALKAQNYLRHIEPRMRSGLQQHGVLHTRGGISPLNHALGDTQSPCLVFNTAGDVVVIIVRLRNAVNVVRPPFEVFCRGSGARNLEQLEGVVEQRERRRLVQP